MEQESADNVSTDKDCTDQPMCVVLRLEDNVTVLFSGK